MEEDSDPSDFAGGGETSEMLFDELSDPTTVSQAARIGHLQAMRQLLEDGGYLQIQLSYSILILLALFCNRSHLGCYRQSGLETSSCGRPCWL